MYLNNSIATLDEIADFADFANRANHPSRSILASKKRQNRKKWATFYSTAESTDFAIALYAFSLFLCFSVSLFLCGSALSACFWLNC
jgi:hypothetical protein